MTLANWITMIRIFLSPLIFISMVNRYPKFWILSIFLIAISTDLIDGLIARLKNQKSQLGKLLDPLADKLLLIGVFVALAYLDRKLLWFVIVIFCRDLIIVTGWIILYILKNRKVINPNLLGKITVCLQTLTAFLLILGYHGYTMNTFIYITMFSSVISGLQYIIRESRDF